MCHTSAVFAIDSLQNTKNAVRQHHLITHYDLQCKLLPGTQRKVRNEVTRHLQETDVGQYTAPKPSEAQ